MISQNTSAKDVGQCSCGKCQKLIIIWQHFHEELSEYLILDMKTSFGPYEYMDNKAFSSTMHVLLLVQAKRICVFYDDVIDCCEEWSESNWCVK